MAAAFAAACAVIGVAVPRAQGAKSKAPAGDVELPPLTYICPMPQDAEIAESKPGKCPKCGMTLLPARLDTIWTCPVHAAIHESKSGKCPLDGRDLVQVIVSIAWKCPGSETTSLNPGSCPDGSARTKTFNPRAHGNHNPQHGGQFFMAPDNSHHLEGTYRSTGVFRMFLYNDFTKPLPLAQVRTASGVVVAKDAATGRETTFPLVRNGQWLDAKVGKQPFPAQMYAKVKFGSSPDYRFDFTFEGFSKEPAAGSTSTMTMSTMTPVAAPAPAPAASPFSTPDLSSGVDPALVPVPIPETVPEMLAQLRTRTDQIRTFIDKGAFAAIYVPAFQAKDLALALDEHKAELAGDRQRVAIPAIARLVRSAYLLDAFGDIGNKQQILEAYDRFSAAVKDIESAFPGRP